MNFIRLYDPLLSFLFENEDIIAIDKPYGFNAHTNDSKIEHSDFIQDGLIEIFEKHLGTKLHIIHRLDQTTTGVMIFGKSAESAKKYAEFFFQRLVKKTYIFISKKKFTETHFLVDSPIIHKGRELEASTHFTWLKSEGAFSLWQANPHTGRNHQIRIHAQVAGISLLGDTKYEGDEYPFLCLHNREIEFPNSVIVRSRPPPYFDDLSLFEDSVLSKSLFDIDRRLRLYSDESDSNKCLNSCYRLIHHSNQHAVREPGFSLDQYGEALVLNWSRDVWSQLDERRFKKLAGFLKKRICVRFMNKKSQVDSIPDSKNSFEKIIEPIESVESEVLAPHNKALEWMVEENQQTSVVKAFANHGPGLPLHLRLHRNWVCKNSKDKKVLILFSNTGSFAVSAVKGGAAQVTCVDLSKTLLDWSRKNLELNSMALDSVHFYCRDSLSFAEQSLKKAHKFDLIVCEAPSFYRREKGVFKIEKDLDPLLKTCLSSLSEKGELLFSTMSDDLKIGDIERALLKVKKELKLVTMEMNCILPSMDFELPEERAILKSFLIQL